MYIQYTYSAWVYQRHQHVCILLIHQHRQLDNRHLTTSFGSQNTPKPHPIELTRVRKKIISTFVGQLMQCRIAVNYATLTINRTKEKQNQAKGPRIISQAIQCKICVKGKRQIGTKLIEAKNYIILARTLQDSRGNANSLLAHCLLHLWHQVRPMTMYVTTCSNKLVRTDQTDTLVLTDHLRNTYF